MWEDPIFSRCLRRLAALGRLICFDPRGQGGSDPVALNALPTIDAWSDDIKAVLAAAGSTHATLLSVGPGAAQVGMYFAAAHPELVEALVVMNGAARLTRADDYPYGLNYTDLEPIFEMTEREWGTGELAGVFAPSRGDDPTFRQWHARYERLAATPKTSRALLEFAFQLDVRDALPLIHLPTLVLHAEANQSWEVGFSEYLATHIEGAQLALIPGEDSTIYGLHPEHALGPIERFVTGAQPTPEPTRLLATVLFTDIVGSTDLLARFGDTKWMAILDEHDDVLARELARFRGSKINATGDGMVATFDAPGRAVECATAICNAIRTLGIEVRAGVHTGEIEQRDGDVGGLGVHIGQRVSALAQPGEVLVTRTVTDLVTGSGIEFADRGNHELKGVPGSWRLYAVAG